MSSLVRGFASTRGRSEKHAQVLETVLKAKHKIVVCRQVDLVKTGEVEQHQTAARRLIEHSHFIVVFISPDVLKPAQGKSEATQGFEIDIARRRLDVLHDRPAGEAKEVFQVFPVFLQDEHGRPTHAEYEQMLEQYGKGWLGPLTQGFEIRNAFSTSDADWRPAIEDLASKIDYWALYLDPDALNLTKEIVEPKIKAGIAPVSADPAPPPGPPLVSQQLPPPPARADELTAVEHAYILRNLQLWTQGRIGACEARKEREDSPFHFAPSRYVELEVTRLSAGAPGSREGEATAPPRDPVSVIVFRGDSPLTALSGGVGSGKTTTLCTLASMCASPWDAQFARQVSREIRGVAQALDALTVRRVPVLLRCTEIAVYIEQGMMGTDAILAAIDRKMHLDGDALIGPRIEALRARLKQQPYMLFLDALDEVGEQVGPRAVANAAIALYEQFEEHASLSIVVSHRPEVEVHQRFESIQLAALTDTQVDDFVEYFGKSWRNARGGDAVPAALRREVKLVRDDERHRDLIHSPLTLNVVCWLASNQTTFVGSRSNLCAKVTDYLLRDRMVAFQDGNTIDKAMTLEALCVLATEALEGDEASAAGSLPEGLAIRCVRTVLNCGEDAARHFLDQVEVKTNVIYLEKVGRPRYVFRLLVVCEYMAGERLRAVGLKDAAKNVSVDQIVRWTSAFGYAFAREASEGESMGKNAKLLPMSLLDKARDAQDASHALAWLRACLAVIQESDQDFKPTGGAPFGDLTPVVDDILAMVRRLEPKWPLRSRAEIRDAVSRLPIILTSRADEGADYLLGQLLAPRSKWVSISSASLAYFVADTPVLVRDFAQFLQQAPREGEMWSHVRDPSELTFIDQVQSDDGPAGEIWQMQAGRPGAPVVCVTWYEAVGYCRWRELRERKAGTLRANEVIRLPTEDEYLMLSKLMARGARFPWGSNDNPASGEDAPINWRGADLDGPTPPGVFLSCGVKGLYDFGSNVRAWTCDQSEGGPFWPPPPPPPKGPGRRPAAAGGSWAEDWQACSLRGRHGYDVLPRKSRSWRIGFRPVRTTCISAGTLTLSEGAGDGAHGEGKAG